MNHFLASVSLFTKASSAAILASSSAIRLSEFENTLSRSRSTQRFLISTRRTSSELLAHHPFPRIQLEDERQRPLALVRCTGEIRKTHDDRLTILCLASKPVNAAGSLFDRARVPGKVMMDDVTAESLKIHAFSHVFHYGSGMFEGLRIYKTRSGSAAFRPRTRRARSPSGIGSVRRRHNSRRCGSASRRTQSGGHRVGRSAERA